ncbi:MAG: hypothetical protein J6K48_03290 [Lachnospiraceae bacterium]|nr:hypothetical protein [Lachnospiraceae bacterium]
MDRLEQRLNIMSNQMTNMQKQLANVQRLLISTSGQRSSGVIHQPVIVGIKDISSAQLYHAYKKGLNLEQLCQLADGKYTADQIYRKIQKMEAQ